MVLHLANCGLCTLLPALLECKVAIIFHLSGLSCTEEMSVLGPSKPVKNFSCVSAATIAAANRGDTQSPEPDHREPLFFSPL